VLACLREGDRRSAADAMRDHIIDSLDRDAQQAHISGLIKKVVYGNQG